MARSRERKLQNQLLSDRRGDHPCDVVESSVRARVGSTLRVQDQGTVLLSEWSPGMSAIFVHLTNQDKSKRSPPESAEMFWTGGTPSPCHCSRAPTLPMSAPARGDTRPGRPVTHVLPWTPVAVKLGCGAGRGDTAWLAGFLALMKHELSMFLHESQTPGSHRSNVDV